MSFLEDINRRLQNKVDARKRTLTPALPRTRTLQVVPGSKTIGLQISPILRTRVLALQPKLGTTSYKATLLTIIEHGVSELECPPRND